MIKKTRLYRMLILFFGMYSLSGGSWAIEQDDVVPALQFATEGVESVFHDGTKISETILRHIRAFVTTDSTAVAKDYKKWSTLTFGPGGDSAGATVDVVGKKEIENTFESFFTGDVFPPGTVLTITSASRIGSQFYQTFEYKTAAADCSGTDTFVVLGQKIRRQTAYIICTPR